MANDRFAPTALRNKNHFSRGEPVLVALCAWGQRHARELNELNELAECVIKPVHTKRSKVLRGLSLD